MDTPVSVPNVRKRAAGKLAKTTYVNEVVDALSGQFSLPSIGTVTDRTVRLGASVLVRADTDVSISGVYLGVVKDGPANYSQDEDPDLDKLLVDGPQCVIIDFPEIKRTPASHRITASSVESHLLPGILIGVDKVNSELAVVLVNFGRKSWTHARIKPDGTYLQYTTVDTDTLIGLSDDDWHDEIPLTKCTATSTEALMAAMA
jgi:hypothetical protein